MPDSAKMYLTVPKVPKHCVRQCEKASDSTSKCNEAKNGSAIKWWYQKLWSLEGSGRKNGAIWREAATEKNYAMMKTHDIVKAQRATTLTFVLKT